MPAISYQDTDKNSTFVRMRKSHSDGFMRAHYTGISTLVYTETFLNKTISEKKKVSLLVSGSLQVLRFVGTELRLDFGSNSLSGR